MTKLLVLSRAAVGERMASPGVRGARWLETTISPDNAASQALFRGYARDLGVSCEVSEYFRAEHFPGATHQPEALYRIGPLGSADRDRQHP